METPDDPVIRSIVDSGVGDALCILMIVVPVMLVFLVYTARIEYTTMTKPTIDFEKRRLIVQQTKNYSVFDMDDVEFHAFVQSLSRDRDRDD